MYEQQRERCTRSLGKEARRILSAFGRTAWRRVRRTGRKSGRSIQRVAVKVYTILLCVCFDIISNPPILVLFHRLASCRERRLAFPARFLALLHLPISNSQSRAQGQYGAPRQQQQQQQWRDGPQELRDARGPRPGGKDR